MKLTIIRDTYTSKSTIGKLFIDGVEFCYTLEDVARAEGIKVYGETAIPKGIYSTTLSYSNRFKEVMPLIYNKPDLSVRDLLGVRFDGIRIHWGNKAEHSHGCILLGSTKSKDFIGNSKKTYKKFIELLGDIDIVKLEIINNKQL
ncbi:MAG: hypothetical protein H8E16_00940 [Flavobacteriales bacterium]|nr:hypothetical protein [Flavobacteriales bacterium]